MKFNTITTILVSTVFLLQACIKTNDPTPVPSKGNILVDASKDGGVWWSPQTGQPGNASTYHQGKKIADYLRSMGYQVDELSRGVTVTWPLLKKYTKVIRAGGFGNYTHDEILAYDSFLNRPSSLMLLQDHLTNFPNDLLSDHLGVKFAGAETGNVNMFTVHPITTGVTSLNYIAGSVVTNAVKNNNMTVLGSIGANNYPVMGILHHPVARILFLGDMNGLEQVPQPLSDNIIKWLY